MTLPWKLVKVAAGTLLLALAASCATTLPPPPSESLLTSAGFKTVAATTNLQQEHLKALPTSQLTELQQTGKHYYVYPDVANNRLYVGTPKEYRAYLALRSQHGMANPAPGSAAGADVQSYLKQDAAMVKADTQDAAIPSWEVWPDFGGLGWIP